MRLGAIDMGKLSKYIGDKQFYKNTLLIAVPIMLQNGLTNVVGLLDNLMVGRVGTDQMSGVAIVNQLMFVFYISIFGGLAGAGIYLAQYFGKQDYEGIRHVFRIKVWFAIFITIGGILILFLGREPLVNMFLHQGGQTGNIEMTQHYAKGYMNIMLVGLIPFAIGQIYSSTLREMGKTIAPMIASMVAVFVNLGLNYILIFGAFGAPKLGANGAAVATIVSRTIEAFIIVFWTHKKKEELIFIKGAFRSFYIPMPLLKKVFVKGLPLFVNEFLWSSGVTFLTQCYSTRGLAAIAGLNICNTINNVFTIVFIAMGDAVAIIVGGLLGAGEMEKAKSTDTKLIAFSVTVCVGIAAIMAICAPVFPQFYNTTEEVKNIATRFIWVMAFLMPFSAFTHAAYFTLRSGGKTMVTFFFDSFFMWIVCAPLAYCLSRYTGLIVIILYAICQGVEIIKAFVGYILVKKDIWIEKIV